MWSSEERLGPPVLKVWFLLLCVTSGYVSTEPTLGWATTVTMTTTETEITRNMMDSSSMNASVMATTSSLTSASVMATTPTSTSSSVVATTPTSTSSSVMATTPTSTSSVMATTPTLTSSSVMATTSSSTSSSVMATTPTSTSSSVMATTSSSTSSSVMATTPTSTSSSVMATTSSSTSASVIATTSSSMNASLMETTPSSMSTSVMDTTSSSMSTSVMETASSSMSTSVMETASSSMSTSVMETASSSMTTSVMETASSSMSTSVMETTSSSMSTTVMETASSSMSTSVMETTASSMSTSVMATTSSSMSTSVMDTTSSSTSASVMDTTSSSMSTSVMDTTSSSMSTSVMETTTSLPTSSVTTSTSVEAMATSERTMSVSLSAVVTSPSPSSMLTGTVNVSVELTADVTDTISPTSSVTLSTGVAVGPITTDMSSEVPSTSGLEETVQITSIAMSEAPLLSTSGATVETTPTASILTSGGLSSTSAVDSTVETTLSPSATDGFTTSMSSISEISSQVPFSLSPSSSDVSSVDTTSVFSIEQSTSSMMVEITVDFSSSPSPIPSPLLSSSSLSPSPSPSSLSSLFSDSTTTIGTIEVTLTVSSVSSSSSLTSLTAQTSISSDSISEIIPTMSLSTTSEDVPFTSTSGATVETTPTMSILTSSGGPPSTSAVDSTVETTLSPSATDGFTTSMSSISEISSQVPFSLSLSSSDVSSVDTTSVFSIEQSTSSMMVEITMDFSLSSPIPSPSPSPSPSPLGPPENLTAIAINSSAVNVTWDPPSSVDTPEISYLLEYYLTNDTGDNFTVSVNQTSAVLSELMAFTNYTITVQAVTSTTGPVTMVTVITAEGVPDPVRNLSLIAVNSTAIRVTWEDPAIINGQIQNFIVEYTKSDTAGVVLNSSVNINELSLSGLDIYTLYNITVATVTGGGTGDGVTMQKRTFPLRSSPPVNVTIGFLTPDDGNITWSPPTSLNGGKILSYEVLSNLSTGDLNVTCIAGEDCVFEFNVTDVDSLHSVEVYVLTNATHEDLDGGSSVFRSEPGNINFIVTEEIPEGPVNVSSSFVNSTAIQFVWDEPFAMDTITGYSVSHNSSGSSPVDISGRSFLLSSLDPFTVYRFSVYAITVRSRGFEEGIAVTTGEDAPDEAPANFSVDIINSTEIQVSWQQPSPPINGIIINYVLFVNSSDGLVTLNSTNSSLLITGLTSFTEYYISIAAETNGGRGPFTTPFPVTTNESSPANTPANFSVDIINSTEIQVSWRQPPPPINGMIINYVLFVNSSDGLVTLNSTNSSLLITGLTPFTEYYISIAAETNGGRGPFTTPFPVTTNESQPDAPPQNLTINVLSSTSVQLSWEPPIQTTHNGILRTYHILVVNNNSDILVDSSVTTHNISNLTPFTRYSYQIRAENNAGVGPYSEAVNATTLEDAPANTPANFSVDIINSTEIQVSWQQPPPPINGMIINYVLFVNSSDGLVTLNSTNSSLLITGLTSFTEYYISIAAETNGGRGPFTTPFPVTTNESQPDAPPQNLTINVLSSTSVQLSWEPPIQTTHNGILRTYHILVVNNNSDILVDSSVTTHNISNLTPFTRYSFQIRAENNAGVGPYSEAVNATTLEDAPANTPANFSVDIINSTEIQVSWQQPSPPINGMIINYVLFVNSSDGLVTLNSTNSSLLITGLTSFTEYYISIAAETNGGRGPFTTPFPVTTNESQPDAPPQNLTINVLSSTSVQLSWEPPIQTTHNGILRTYHILVVNNNSDILVDSSVTTHNISNLTPFTRYSFQIRAENNAGVGPYSEAVNATTLEDAPANNPDDFSVDIINSTEIQVSWRQPPPPINGMIINYVLFVNSSDGLVTLNSTNSSLLITGLTPFTEYYISIAAETNGGRGPFTTPFPVTTNESQPDAPPQNLTINVLSSTSVQLSWEPPIQTTHNGILRTYHILVVNNNSDILVDSSVTTHNISNLTPFTRYSYQIRAENNAGVGPYSEAVNATTLEDVPGAPRNLTASANSSTVIVVKFTSPLVTNGILTRFEVTHRGENSTSDESVNVTVQAGAEYCVYLVGLDPFTLYGIRVRAHTSAGPGVSVDTEERTLEGEPSAPRNVRVSPINSSALRVEWDVPSSPRGIIRFYTVDYLSNAPSENTSANETVLVLGSLSPFTTYNVSVRAFTVAYGNSSDVAMGTTNETNPSPPTNVIVSHTDSTSVMLSWQPPTSRNGMLMGYQASFNQTIDCDGRVDNDTKSVSETSVQFTGLEEDTVYVFYVTSINRAGESTPVNISTKTNESVPASAPSFTLDSTVTNITVAWQPIPPCEQNGDIVSYNISVNGADTSMYYERPGNANQLIITGLSPYRQYNISMAASTGAGQGVFSPLDTIRTMEDVPGVPEGIIVYNITSMSIGLSWDPPPLNKRNGLIVNYTVQYRDEKGTKEVSSMSTYVLITGLSPYTNYSISVAAWTSVGRGEFTDEQVIPTDQDVPGAPTISTTTSPNSTSLMISWTPPAVMNGVILIYSVYYVQSEASDCAQTLTNAQMKNTSSLDLTIGGLKVFTMYCLQVRAYTAAGGGVTSDYVAVRTDPSAASSPNITDTMATARTITINWTTPDDTNGDIVGYLIAIEGIESNHTSVNLSYTFHSLQPFTTYNITVRAYSFSAEEDPFMRIDGEVTAKVVTTMEDYPSMPTDLKITSTPVVLVLEWGHPAEPNGKVTGYLVYVDGDLTVSLTESATKYVLSSLSSSQSYTVCVAAVNGRGEGQKACQTDSLENQTTPSPPPVDTTDTTGVTLTFSIPEPLRGDAVRYLVLVQPLSSSGSLFEEQDTYENVLKAIQEPLGSIPYYVALNESFSNNRRKRDGLDRHTRAASPTQEVRLGNEAAKDCGDGPCNAPLTPGIQYTMRMDVVDTSGNEFIADMINVTTAKVTAPPPSSTEVVAAVVVVAFLIVTVVIVTLVVIGVVYYCKWRTKRGHYSPGDLYDNEAIILTRSGNMKTGHSYTLGPEIVPLNQRQNGNGSLIISNMHSLEMSHKVKLEDLPAHFTSMSADSGYQFSEEYETITDVGLDHSKDASLLTANRAKNRYTNILAYDHSRVKLSYIDDEQGSDYINANYIPGYRNRRAYIATQGPLPCTFDDFWRMVWEHNTAIIVMLTKLNERGRTKCHQYWPEKSDIYSDITITLTSETKFEEWMVREFDLVKDNKKHSVIHFQYTAWPDHGVPDETKGAIEFVKGVRSHVQNEHGPLVVHCSAGVGRTGTFIALDTLLQHIKENDHVDIFGLACDMRQHRNHMIQTEAQYVFIHKALLQVVKPTTFTNMRKSTSYHPLSPTLSEEYDSTYEQSQRTQAERYHMEESII